MPLTCIIVNCGSRADRDAVKFYAIPKILQHIHLKNKNELSKLRREKWLSAIKRDDLTDSKIKYQRVCSKHFISGKPAALENIDDPDWVPSQNLGHTSIVFTKKPETLTRSTRLKRRKINLDEPSTPWNLGMEIVEDDENNKTNEDSGTQTQTIISGNDMVQQQKDVMFMNEQLSTLKITIQKTSITYESFVADDKKCKYYTGLSSSLLVLVFNQIKDNISVHPVQALEPSLQLVLTLMKLRLNLAFKDLSFRFGISATTASTYFQNIVDILYNTFKVCIVWPERSVTAKNIPKCFKVAFQEKTTVIIDCFEIFIEKPSNFLTNAQCWSNYKHHTTVKFLIGVTPQGTISYISDAWGGRASDKQITEMSGFLNKILPGDIILADRGFLIRDMVTVLGAKLVMPAFTKGVSQLHPLEIEETRNIAHVRIHVERIIGYIKSKYKILDGPLPISMVSTVINDQCILDKVVIVCAAFINLSPPIVPIE